MLTRCVVHNHLSPLFDAGLSRLKSQNAIIIYLQTRYKRLERKAHALTERSYAIAGNMLAIPCRFTFFRIKSNGIGTLSCCKTL